MTSITNKILSLAACAGLAATATAQAEILVNADIAVSTTWTKSNTYNLQKQIYVLPGATLTIEAGTVIASTTNLGGSLAVTRGAKIFVQGTEMEPVIMTSKADVATWTGGNPKTGSWREAANEWGNLTIMGSGYISENATPGNSATPSASNIAAMEGLIASGPGDTKVLYGGGNDNDDSGSISYLSMRYGGKVIGLNNELNGMSLGGIGRDTDIGYIEIMNNVDDGVEIWGGTVNIHHFSIWNIGDDSFDVDQGWRGKAQFGLVVQGHSLDANQGSGVGDNAFEVDGAEDSNWQPVTTTTIYNCTVIGQPFDGDGLTAWRDNARVQYRNCIFMDCGEKVVRFDDKDGDGASGYGFNGTLSWDATWTTPYTATSPVNAPANPAAFYMAQSSGMLSEIKDSVFFGNKNRSAYTEAIARGVFAASNNNVREPATSPITSISRGTAVLKGGKAVAPVTFLDPRPAADALTSVGFAPNDGFFESARYRGAFGPGRNWLGSWSAAGAFGMVQKDDWTDVGHSLVGANGAPSLAVSGNLQANQSITVSLSNAAANAPAFIAIGVGRLDVPFVGGTIVPNFNVGGLVALATNGSGELSFPATIPSNSVAGFGLYLQYWVGDAGAPAGLSASNGILGLTR